MEHLQSFMKFLSKPQQSTVSKKREMAHDGSWW
jgi:hypothetical protein